MNVFKKIMLSITNSNRVRKQITPYFNSVKKLLSSFILIDSEVPEQVDHNILLLSESEPKKYLKLFDTISDLKHRIEIHNKHVMTINYINENKDIFKYDNIINDPLIIENENHNEIKEAIDYTGSLNNKPVFSVNLDVLNKIICNYPELCNQFKLYNLYNKECDFSEYEYIDNKRKNDILKKINTIISKINIKLLFYDFSKHTNIDNMVKEHNEKWINDNIDANIFESINNKSLDEDQRKAILTDELATLVVAGAGSGKTLTICGKIKYLLEEKNVNPEDILLLSYSKKSALDLQEKVSEINNHLTVGTFHKIGLEILMNSHNKKFMIEEQFNAIIEEYFRKAVKSRPNILKIILEYYGLYISSDKFEKKYKNKGELYENLKRQDFSTLKGQLQSLSNDINKKETIKKEMVKSFEELSIANWYFINGIEYLYEAPYEVDVSTVDKRQYMPDFYLPEYKIYHEHYGVNKENKAEQYDGEEAATYVKNMAWKRQIHTENQTVCLETYSWEFKDGIIFKKLEKELKEKDVEFKPLSEEQIFNALKSVYDGQSFKSFINLIRSFISLYKSRYRDISGFDQLLHYKHNNEYEGKRAILFLSIVKDIYQFYIDCLRKEGKIDFDDMIFQSSEELDYTHNFKYKYIIVDEFQDISFSRMQFLKKLISHGNSKLFAVGDDWQAIYRFSGCDINIFLNFADYFGPSAITNISNTFRNSQELQNIACMFIRSNPEQLIKNIKSSKHLENPIQIIYYSNEKYTALFTILERINKVNPEANVLLLGRNNKDIETLLLDKMIYKDIKESTENNTVIKISKYSKMKFTYCTVHASKGLEEDYIIIINADDSRLGFPNKVEDDELLDMVLSSKSTYEFAEERRLWYVALTRTKNYTYIIANESRPSVFVKEIEKECLVINHNDDTNNDKEITCPRCKSGKLIIRINEQNKKSFYGCSNYPYCDYVINDLEVVNKNIRCRFCGDFMILRKGKYGAFYGCHNYPRCKYKEEYISNSNQ